MIWKMEKKKVVAYSFKKKTIILLDGKGIKDLGFTADK